MDSIHISKEDIPVLDNFAGIAMESMLKAKFDFMNTNLHDPAKETQDLFANIGDTSYLIAGIMMSSREKFISDFSGSEKSNG